MATVRGFLRSRVRHLFSAVLVLLGVVTIIPAFNGAATAHHAEATAKVSCDGVISWTATAWEGYPDDPNTPQNEYDLSRTNSNVRVWIEIIAGGGVAPADQSGAFNSGNGYTFSGTFQWPAGATIVTLKAEALAIWGNGGGAGSGPWPVYLELPTDCEGTPGVSVNPRCDNATDHSGDGTVVVSFTNTGGPFAESVTFSVAAFGGQPATTVTVAVGATETRTYTGLPDGSHTIGITLNGKDFSKTFTIDCDKASPSTSAVASCNLESNGQILLTLSNAGGESVTFTVVGPDGVSRDFTVDAGGAPATYTYLDLADAVYVITITASDGTTGLNQTVTVDCDHPDPKASAVAACTENFDGVITITLLNAGNEAVTFRVTDPRNGTFADVPVGAGVSVPYVLSGFADGVVVIPIVANGKTLDVTVTVDCDPVFDLRAICTDVTAEDVYWYAIKNTETTDLVVTWDGGTLNVLAGTTVNIASTVAPLSLKFNGVEIATAGVNSDICKQTTIFEKKLNGQPPTGETYTIRVSRLDDSTFFEDLTFDLDAGETLSVDLPSTLFPDGVDYFIEELDNGTASKSIINVNGTGGSILTASGHLNETISVVVVNGYAAIEINKQLVTTQVIAGGQITYTLQAENTGGLNLEDVVITDLLPPATAFVSATVQDNGGTCALVDSNRPQLLRCSMTADLPVDGFTKIITLVVKLDGDVAENTAIVNQSMVQGNFANAVLSVAGVSRQIHSQLPAAVTQLTCPGLPGEVCDLSPVVTITVSHKCGSGTTTTSPDCGGTTTTSTTIGCGGSGTTTTSKSCGGTTTTIKTTTTVSGTLPKSGGGGESKPMLSMAFGFGCIGSALLLSRPRLPRRWRVAAH
ncbi:MAG: DUF11 domain-containing protein [Actinomycetia bacterium]|nr:DUF11 domain-containing protein [Actinomycetes bacterium]